MVKDGENNDKRLLLAVQEIELAKLLAGNNKKVRDKALKNLKKWFDSRAQAVPFTENDFERIWKGLFYSMWMSDKPLVQEECAENISNLVHFPTYKLSLQFFKAGLIILNNEWFGIDQLRLDKFLMLVRRFLRHMLMVLRDHGFTKDNINQFNEVLSDTILIPYGNVALGLAMHFTEIFMEELAKITEGVLHPDSVTELLRPFVRKLASSDDGRQIGHIRKFIFTYLLRQSDFGLEYQAKYNAWKQLGFPGSIDSMQKVKLDDDERMSSEEEDEDDDRKKEKALDPRAGRVNVELPQIKFNAKKIASLLLEHKFNKETSTRGRKMLSALHQQFLMLSQGKYPLGIKKLEVKENKNDKEDMNIRKAANRLMKFQKKLMGNAKKRKMNNKSGEEDDKPLVKKQKLSENDSEHNLKKTKNKNMGDNKINKKALQKSIESMKTQDVDIETNENVTAESKKKKLAKKLQLEKKNGMKSKTISNSNEKLFKKDALKNHRNINEQNSVIDNIEYVFERNSGTWVVYDVTNKPEDKLGTNDIENIESERKVVEDHFQSVAMGNSYENPTASSSPKKSRKSTIISADVSPDLFVEESNKLVSPEKLKKPIKLLESPPRGRALFPKTEWDEALQEGEYEVFVPSKKYLKRMQKLAKKNGQTNSQVLVTPSQNNQVKSRRSLDPSIIKNPFATPSSGKKVKINTKLNRSQEIYEHHMQILSSPAIPHDPDKKPVKPVLKSPVTTNSINPFYDKQLSIW